MRPSIPGTSGWTETGGSGNSTTPTSYAGVYQTINPVESSHFGLITDTGVFTETISQTFTLGAGERLGKLFRDVLPASLEQVGGWAFLRSRGRQGEDIVNPEAHDLYWRGLAHSIRLSHHELETASHLLEQAIERDPGFVDAYAELGSVYGNLAFMGSRQDNEAKAKKDLDRALQLDSHSARAWAALAYLDFNNWDWAGAEQKYRRAIQIDPQSAAARESYAYMLVIQARVAEAREQIEKAAPLNPLGYRIPHIRDYAAMLEGRYDDAERENATAMALVPDNPMVYGLRGFIHSLSGRHEEAIQDFHKGVELTKSSLFLGELGWAYGLAGKKPEAEQMLKKLLAERSETQPCDIASVYTGLGDQDRALDWLEKAYQARDLSMREIRMNPAWTPLRDNPRFRQLVEKIGLGNGFSAH